VSKQLLKDVTPQGQPRIIEAKPGAFASLLSGGGTLMQTALDSLNRVNRVLSDQNIQKFDAIMSDVQSVTAELRERKAIIADADKALVDADQAAQQIRDLAKSSKVLVDGDGTNTVVKIGAAADQIQGAAADARTMLKKLEGPTSNFASNGLPQLTATVAQLQISLEHLDRLVDEIERDPRAFVNKPTAKQVEVKP